MRSSAESSHLPDLMVGLTLHPAEFRFAQQFTDRWGGLFTLEGEGAIELDGASLPLEPGDLVLYEPGHRHEFYSPGLWRYYWFHFPLRPHISPGRFRHSGSVPSAMKVHFDGGEQSKVREALEEAHELSLISADRGNPLAMLLVESTVQRVCDRLERTSPYDPRIAKARKMLLSEGAVDMDSVAASCGMSHTAFYNLFRLETGCSPRRFREKALMEQAKSLLICTDLSLRRIAMQLGISDPFYFSARFKALTGESPSAFRNRRGEKNV